MLFNLVVSFRHPCLGADPERESDLNSKCQLPRTRTGLVYIPKDLWFNVFRQAFAQLGIKQDPGIITMAPSPDAKVVIFRRTYNRRSFRLHEAIPEGVNTTFPGMCRMDDGGKEQLNLEQLNFIFTLVGDHLGISPWGRNHPYGLFDVISNTNL